MIPKYLPRRSRLFDRLAQAGAGLLLFALILTTACTLAQYQKLAKAPTPVASPTPTPVPPPTIDGGRVVQTWARYGSVGHACPVSSTEAYTADHVAVVRNDTDPVGGWPLFFMWGDSYGNSGTLLWQWSDYRRDLSYVLSVEGEFHGWFNIARELPKVGDTVVIVGYNYPAGAVDRPERAKILQLRAGYFTYDNTPGGGSSGSCVLNEAGEIVGINVWGFGEIGAGVLMAGGWANVPEQFRQQRSK